MRVIESDTGKLLLWNLTPADLHCSTLMRAFIEFMAAGQRACQTEREGNKRKNRSRLE